MFVRWSTFILGSSNEVCVWPSVLKVTWMNAVVTGDLGQAKNTICVFVFFLCFDERTLVYCIIISPTHYGGIRFKRIVHTKAVMHWLGSILSLKSEAKDTSLCFFFFLICSKWKCLHFPCGAAVSSIWHLFLFPLPSIYTHNIIVVLFSSVL